VRSNNEVIAPLHAADWRFLLPHPLGKRHERLVVLGGPAGIAARAHALNLATVVQTECPPNDSADLVVARHDATDKIDRIARMVAPAGCLYLEVDRGLRGYHATSYNRVRRTLTASGLSILQAYAVEGEFGSQSALIPIDSAAALRWHAGMPPRTRQEWVSMQIRWAAAHLFSPTKTILSRRFAIVAVAGDMPDPSPSVFRDRGLLQSLNVDPSDLRGAMITRGRDRVILVPFSKRTGAALAVVKVSKHPSFNQRTVNEHVWLETLCRRYSEAFVRALPQPLALLTKGDLAISVQSFVPGRLLSRLARGPVRTLNRRVSDLSLAMDWLIRMHVATETARTPWDDSAHQRWVETPFAALTLAAAISPAERALLDATRQRSLDLRGAALPTVCQHRDLNIWNVVRERDAIGVLDWEGAIDGLPLCDAFQLVTSWLQAVAFPRRFDGETLALKSIFTEQPGRRRAVEAAVGAIDHYLRGMRFDPRFVPVLLVALRAELVLRRAEQKRLLLDGTALDVEPEYAAFKMLAEECDAVFERRWAPAR